MAARRTREESADKRSQVAGMAGSPSQRQAPLNSVEWAGAGTPSLLRCHPRLVRDADNSSSELERQELSLLSTSTWRGDHDATSVHCSWHRNWVFLFTALTSSHLAPDFSLTQGQ
jgi:hypothetical protein